MYWKGLYQEKSDPSNPVIYLTKRIKGLIIVIRLIFLVKTFIIEK